MNYTDAKQRLTTELADAFLIREHADERIRNAKARLTEVNMLEQAEAREVMARQQAEVAALKAAAEQAEQEQADPATPPAIPFTKPKPENETDS